MPPPYADSIAPIIHSAHFYDKGGWEMSKVCTETDMKSNWSETEMFKIKERMFLYSKTDVRQTSEN